jgi:hypothetical protein
MDLDNRELARVIIACKKLGLKPACPVYKNDCAAHVGIPSKKIAFYVREKVELSRYANEYKKWAGHGWTMMRVSHQQLRILTDDQIVEHLREALKVTGKTK